MGVFAAVLAEGHTVVRPVCVVHALLGCFAAFSSFSAELDQTSHTGTRPTSFDCRGHVIRQGKDTRKRTDGPERSLDTPSDAMHFLDLYF